MKPRLKFALEQNKKYPSWKTVGEYPNLPDYVTYCDDSVRIHFGVRFTEQGFGYEWYEDEWLHIPHSGQIELYPNVELFEDTIIVRGTGDDDITIIGEGTKIDCLCHIAHNVKIGKHCLIGARVGIGGSTVIGDNVRIGGQVYIYNKIKIGNDCEILPGSVVRKDLPDGTIYKSN